MKKLLILVLLTCGLSAQISRLPEEFQVVERFLSLTSTFDVGTEVGSFAVARKRFFSLTTTFDLVDSNEMPLASASSRFFAWGTVADIADPAGNKIGWIEEEIFRILPWAEYRVYNSQNQIVALAKMNFWGTYFELTHPNQPDQIYATITRPFIRCWRDDWTVQIKDYSVFEQEIIDPRLLIMLAIYQTDKDNRDWIRREIIDQLQLEQNENEGRRLEVSN